MNDTTFTVTMQNGSKIILPKLAPVPPERSAILTLNPRIAQIIDRKHKK